MTETRLTAEDRARLRAMAEQAAPGPWVADGCVVESADDRRRMIIYDEGGHTEADAAHIAAFHPKTALALLDQVDALERERDEARRVIAGMDVEREKAAETARRAEQYQRERDEARDALIIADTTAANLHSVIRERDAQLAEARAKLAAVERQRDYMLSDYTNALNAAKTDWPLHAIVAWQHEKSRGDRLYQALCELERENERLRNPQTPEPTEPRETRGYIGPIEVGMSFIWTPTGERVTVTKVGRYNGYLRVWCRDPKSGREVMNDEHRWREACVPTAAIDVAPSEPKGDPTHE